MASISKPFYIEPGPIQRDPVVPVEFVAKRRSMDSSRSKEFSGAIAKYKRTWITNNLEISSEANIFLKNPLKMAYLTLVK